MKKNGKYILWVVLFLLILVAAFFGYRLLSKSYNPEKATTSSSDASTQAAVDFTVLDESGQSVHLSDFFGKPIVINFWASWCGPCKSELQAFNNAYTTYKDDVVFLMVNQTDGKRDTVQGVKDFVAAQQYTFPVYYDTEFDAARSYNIRSIPMSAFINAEGEVVGIHRGVIQEDTLTNTIESMMGGT